jgi:hypothetical protein
MKFKLNIVMLLVAPLMGAWQPAMAKKNTAGHLQKPLAKQALI